MRNENDRLLHVEFCILHFAFALKNGLVTSPFCLPSSSALAPVVGILLHAGELAVGFGHESLQLFLEQLVSGLGRSGLDRSALGPGILVLLPVLVATLAVLETAFPALEIAVAAFTTLETALPGGVSFPLRLGLQPLNGQIDLAIVSADDHDLHILPLG